MTKKYPQINVSLPLAVAEIGGACLRSPFALYTRSIFIIRRSQLSAQAFHYCWLLQTAVQPFVINHKLG